MDALRVELPIRSPGQRLVLGTPWTCSALFGTSQLRFSADASVVSQAVSLEVLSAMFCYDVCGVSDVSCATRAPVQNLLPNLRPVGLTLTYKVRPWVMLCDSAWGFEAVVVLGRLTGEVSCSTCKSSCEFAAESSTLECLDANCQALHPPGSLFGHGKAVRPSALGQAFSCSEHFAKPSPSCLAVGAHDATQGDKGVRVVSLIGHDTPFWILCPCNRYLCSRTVCSFVSQLLLTASEHRNYAALEMCVQEEHGPSPSADRSCSQGLFDAKAGERARRCSTRGQAMALLVRDESHQASCSDDWVSEGLRVCLRTLLLLYLLACFHLMMIVVPQRKGLHRRNRAIRFGRNCLKGAPLVLAFGIVAYMLPICAGMPTDARTQAVRKGLDDVGSLEGNDGSFHEPVTPGDTTRVNVAQTLCGPSASGRDPKFEAQVFRFQASTCTTAIWIDRGDTADFVRSTVQDELFLGSIDRLVNVEPQPHVPFAVFLDAPEWLLSELRVPVLIEVHSREVCRYLETFVGKVDSEVIRLALGDKWIPGGQIYVGDSGSPLAQGSIAQLRPGTLIRVLPRGIRCKPGVLLERKVEEPLRWFQPREPSELLNEVEESRHIGLVGVMGDWSTIPAAQVRNVQHLQQAIEESCGQSERNFLVFAPETQPFDLYFRGSRVVSLLAVLPRALSSCYTVFLDAREIGIPVTALFLPRATTNLSHLLALAGGSRPHGLHLQVEGLQHFVPETEQLIPHDKAVVRVSVHRGWDWQADEENGHALPFSSRRTSGHSNIPPVVAAPNFVPCSSNSMPTDTQHVAGTSGAAPSCTAVRGTKRAATGSAYHPASLQHLEKETIRYEQAVHRVAAECVASVDRAPTELPHTGAAPRDAVFGAFQMRDLEEESEAESEATGSPHDQDKWRLPIRVLSFQRQDSFRTLEVSTSDDLGEVRRRILSLVQPPGQQCDLLVPSRQPCSSWLTVLLVPSWWEDQGVERDFVSVCRARATVASLLPNVEPGRTHAVDVYCDDDEEAGDVGWTSGSLLYLTPTGSARPHLPSAAQILRDSTVDCDDGQLPVPEALPATRYLLLGEGFTQSVATLLYGSVTQQVANAVGSSAPDTYVWFQKGGREVFTKMCVQGIGVDKCLGYRIRSNEPGQPHHMIFIDARALGVPVCCRLFDQAVFRVEDFLDAIPASVPEGCEAHFSGGEAVANDPLVRKFPHCTSVTIWVSPSAMEGLTTIQDSSDDANEDHDPGEGHDETASATEVVEDGHSDMPTTSIGAADVVRLGLETLDIP